MNKSTILGMYLTVCLAVILSGCAGGGAREQGPMPSMAPIEKEVASESAAPGAAPKMNEEQYAQQLATTGRADVDPQTGLNRMVIYNASLELVVKDTLQAVESARQIIQDAGGYLKESKSYRDDEQLRASMTARVPAEKLTETLEKLKTVALTVESEGLSGEDVTNEYTDLQSRRRNLEASEKQYLAILEKADKIEDVLAVQRELTTVREQIEQIQGRMDYLSKSAAFATIQITLTPDALARPLAIGGWRPQGTARNAIEALVWALKTLGDILIWAVICILPVALILGLPLFFVVRWIRRNRKPKMAKPQAKTVLSKQE
ncbi:MAG: DUF4349 domain-containing protein [Thermoflexales bacterium]|nr:DUF4349 domain-containing protein [Thermoflexales bacterium]